MPVIKNYKVVGQSGDDRDLLLRIVVHHLGGQGGFIGAGMV